MNFEIIFQKHKISDKLKLKNGKLTLPVFSEETNFIYTSNQNIPFLTLEYLNFHINNFNRFILVTIALQQYITNVL